MSSALNILPLVRGDCAYQANCLALECPLPENLPQSNTGDNHSVIRGYPQLPIFTPEATCFRGLKKAATHHKSTKEPVSLIRQIDLDVENALALSIHDVGEARKKLRQAVDLGQQILSTSNLFNPNISLAYMAHACALKATEPALADRIEGRDVTTMSAIATHKNLCAMLDKLKKVSGTSERISARNSLLAEYATLAIRNRVTTVFLDNALAGFTFVASKREESSSTHRALNHDLYHTYPGFTKKVPIQIKLYPGAKSRTYDDRVLVLHYSDIKDVIADSYREFMGVQDSNPPDPVQLLLRELAQSQTASSENEVQNLAASYALDMGAYFINQHIRQHMG